MKLVFLRITIFLTLSSLSFNPIFGSRVFYQKDPGRKLVVIDAGHGGHDSGAVGRNHKEKDLALQMALKLGQMIKSSLPNVDVEYTRSTDVFLPLYQRIGIANKKKADLFISIHCNYISNSKTKGTETFVMGLHRAAENLAVAQRENEVILMENEYESNYEGYDPNSPVGYIVLSSFQDAYLEKSLDFAAKVENNLSKRGLSASRGVKQAGFAVLRRATMPSVLVETGFISNEDEERWLSSEAGQLQICSSITAAMSSFFGKDNSVRPNPPEPVLASQEITKKVTPEKSESPENNGTSAVALTEAFTIQLAAMKSKIDTKVMGGLAHLGDILIVEENGYFKYQLGEFEEMAQAESVKAKINKLGYKSAFIVKKRQTR